MFPGSGRSSAATHGDVADSIAPDTAKARLSLWLLRRLDTAQDIGEEMRGGEICAGSVFE